MFGEKLLNLRKKKGLSQEELAEKLNITRQTISNWELNQTSPDAKELKLLSKEFGVSIDELLENDIQNILVEKVLNTENNTKSILKRIKIITIVIIVLIGSLFLLLLINKKIDKKSRGPYEEKSIYCKVFDEEHGATIKYDINNNEVIEIATDGYFDTILDLSKFNHVDGIITKIKNYVQEHGGKCTTIKEKDLTKEDDSIVNMYIEEGSITKTGLTVIIEETEDYDISYGNPFYLEKFNYENNKFEPLKLVNDNCAFTLPAFNASPDKPLRLNQNWYCMYKELEKGLYRIVKNAFFNSDTPIDESKVFKISAEFEIE